LLTTPKQRLCLHLDLHEEWSLIVIHLCQDGIVGRPTGATLSTSLSMMCSSRALCGLCKQEHLWCSLPDADLDSPVAMAQRWHAFTLVPNVGPDSPALATMNRRYERRRMNTSATQGFSAVKQTCKWSYFYGSCNAHCAWCHHVLTPRAKLGACSVRTTSAHATWLSVTPHVTTSLITLIRVLIMHQIHWLIKF
jgi:hypothetical protein